MTGLSPFYEFTAILVLAALGGLVGRLLRQPMIVSFIGVGLVAGPSVLGLVESNPNIDLLAELGVAVLLFLVGLKLDLKLIRSLGTISLATGLGQVAFTAIVGYMLGLALGLNNVTAIYVAVALTFSSTIIIVKLLSDKKEVDALHGRIALGFLIVQDLVVVFAMLALSALGIGNSDTGDTPAQRILQMALSAGAMLVLLGLFMRYLAKPLMQGIAHSSELMVIFAIAWAALLAALGDHFGFSKELGGLLAGVSLASTPFREAILSRMSSVRDFLLLFFFIALGAELDLHLLGNQLVPALIFSLFVLVGNPLIVMIIMGVMGFRKRTSFLAGLTVAQISEFSLIFMAMGVSLHHVGAEAMGLVTLVGLITIALSVYMITYSQILYVWLEPALGVFERRVPHREDNMLRKQMTGDGVDVILFGLGRYGGAIGRELQRTSLRTLAVDFNPDVVRRNRRQGFNVIYGDASDQEFIDSLPLRGVQWVIISLPQHDTGVTHHDPRWILIKGLRAHQYAGRIAVSTHHPNEAAELRSAGADVVFLPFHDAAAQAVYQITKLSAEDT